MNDTRSETCSRVADEVPATPVDPEPLLRRGYRRMARTAVAGAVGIACAIVIAVGGVGLIRSSAPTTIPADEGQPTEPPVTVTGETPARGPARVWIRRTDLRRGCASDRSRRGRTRRSASSPPSPSPSRQDGTTRGTRAACSTCGPRGGRTGTRSGRSTHLRGGNQPGACTSSALPDPAMGRIDATVGTSAIELATWVASHPAIVAGAPSPVEVGGLTGYQLDVSLADTWRELSRRAESGVAVRRYLPQGSEQISGTRHEAADPARSAGRRERADRDRRDAGRCRDAGRGLVRVRPGLRS